MTVTQGLIDSIRKRLNEQIPQTGTEGDTHFTDIMLTATLSACDSENQALYLLWTQKSGMVQGDGGNVKQINAGGESATMYTKMDYVSMCLDTAKGYKAAWDAERSKGYSAMSLNRRENSLW